MFKLNIANVMSSLVYGLLWGLLAVFAEISKAGSILNLEWKNLLDVFAMAFIAIVIVLLKNLLTNDEGKFLGLTKVIPDNK